MRGRIVCLRGYFRRKMPTDAEELKFGFVCFNDTDCVRLKEMISKTAVNAVCSRRDGGHSGLPVPSWVKCGLQTNSIHLGCRIWGPTSALLNPNPHFELGLWAI